MDCAVRKCTIAFLVVLLLAATRLQAQEATVIGTVVDESRAVLPGVTITATSLANGRQFSDVSTVQGGYRLVGLPAGRYKLETELQGFAPTVLPEVELLVGQNATIALTLKVASVSESVTVTADAPLVDTRQAQVSGNVDRRQMEELPIPGRNWLELSTMVKGVTANTAGSTPGTPRGTGFRVNLDGQEITQETSIPNFGQPGVSQEAIAEYQIITNLFDVTMGRSTGLQVQAISRAGGNTFDGSLFGYFRDDTLNAADAFQKRVLPYSNQQVGGSQGGPIIKDKLHYFASYEYQREPSTTVLGPNAYAGQTIELPAGEYQHYVLGRGDYQMTGKDHLTMRLNYHKWDHPAEYATHPSRSATRTRYSYLTTGNWSRVVSSNLLQEVKVSYFHYNFLHIPLASGPITPEYIFPGLTLGPNWNYPEDWYQDHVTSRADFTWHKGSHDFKIGSELRVGKDSGWWEARSRGQMFFSRLPADAAARFPLDAWNDPSRWNLAGLDAVALRYDIYYAEQGGQNKGHGNWSFDVPRPMYAGWFGDSWKINDRITVNYGARYDVAWKDFIAPGVTDTELRFNTGFSVEDIGYRSDIQDLNNVSPRGGFAWNVSKDNRFVIRGGSGLYFATQGGNQVIDQQLYNSQRVIANSYVNDGRPGFVADPTRGITAADVLSGRVPLAPQSISVIAHDYQAPSTWQSMIGFQKQLTEVTALDADLVYYRGYHEDVQRDPNLFYDPATGFPKNPTIAGRPAPAFGQINAKDSTGKSDHLALATSFTRRYRDNFQLGMTYTLMFFKHDTGIGNAGYGNQQLNSFDLDYDWARSSEFQRHTLNMNGVWSLPGALTLSGTYHYGSGNYSTLTLPVDTLGLGFARRVRADYSVLDRNTFLGDPWHKMDMRLSKDFRISGDLKLTGIAEIFNVFNYERFNRNTIEGAAAFGQATQSGMDSRRGQLAFRLRF
jgi:hypothetical protein